MPSIVFALASVVLLFFGARPSCAQDPRPKKKLVILAGRKSHGPEGNGIHDYPWSARLLKVMLDHSDVSDRVRTEFHFEGWPRESRTLDDADAIMVISDGRDGDQYEEAPHLASAEHIAAIARQIWRGCGFLTFHFSTFSPDAHAAKIFDWTGGYFDWETDGKRQWYSAIRTVDAEIELLTPQHPVLRGVTPFRLREEFYYNMRFDPADHAFVPLLRVPSLGGREPDGNVIGWARQRPDGGRGFGTTCGHFYEHWRHPDFRKFILNAMVWCSGAEVPPSGVEARFYEHHEITTELERGALAPNP